MSEFYLKVVGKNMNVVSEKFLSSIYPLKRKTKTLFAFSSFQENIQKRKPF
jgi:hypothetical protein